MTAEGCEVYVVCADYGYDGREVVLATRDPWEAFRCACDTLSGSGCAPHGSDVQALVFVDGECVLDSLLVRVKLTGGYRIDHVLQAPT